MFTKTRVALALTFCILISISFTYAQECVPPPIVANLKSTNLFSPEQEMIFGDLTLQNMAGEVRFVRDEKMLAYAIDIGNKLTKHLPPTGLKFQFHIVDLSEANAFNIPGGHVFLSRKLIAFAANEDELAGVVAHELGHAVVRHGATDISEAMRKILNVQTLGDRKDVNEKYNLLIERARTKRFSRPANHENAQQLEADKIGLFAMVAAGYDPSAFASFFDRLTESEGKTGSWFSELFGSTRPAQKRLREMIRATEAMPSLCRKSRGAEHTSNNFLQWQAQVVSLRETNRREELTGLIWKKELAPKLRSDVSHFAFSQSGKHLLAQDDFAVTVIEREPLRVLFQIPVENANQATFTPDGKFVVFTTENLRYEKWSVDEQKPVEVRELVLRQNCWEHKLSPDGNYLACVDTSTAVTVLDVKTGKKVWEKKEFYPLNGIEVFVWLTATKGEDKGTNFFRIEFSPDSRFVMFSRSDKFRFRFSYNGLTEAESENTALALDLSTLKPIKVDGDLKKISSRPYIFLDSGKVLGMPSRKIEDSGVFAFPNGKRLQKFTFAAQEVKPTLNPAYVIVKPLGNTKMGIFDVSKGIVASGMNKADATLWNNTMAFEAGNGKILLREINYNEAAKKFDAKDIGEVEIPVSLIKNLAAAEVSDNFKWMVLSSKTRGGLWNLDKGERKLYLRGFKGGAVADDGAAIGAFPRLDAVPHSIVLMNPHTDTVVPVRELPEKGARQVGRFVLLRTSLDAARMIGKTGLTGDDETDDFMLSRKVRFELKDIVSDKIIWSREFMKEAPGYSFDEFTGRLIFFWSLSNEAGRAKLKESPELTAKAETLGNKNDDYLVEIVDAFAAKTIGEMLLETGNGSFRVGKGLSEGDWLVLTDSENRVLSFSIKEGALRQRFFGSKAAINPKRNQIAVENLPGEITLYNLESGEREARFVLSGGAAFLRFNMAGNRLFALSDTQAIYAFDLNKLNTKTAAK